jgi:hypothetical protein
VVSFFITVRRLVSIGIGIGNRIPEKNLIVALTARQRPVAAVHQPVVIISHHKYRVVPVKKTFFFIPRFFLCGRI